MGVVNKEPALCYALSSFVPLFDKDQRRSALQPDCSSPPLPVLTVVVKLPPVDAHDALADPPPIYRMLCDRPWKILPSPRRSWKRHRYRVIQWWKWSFERFVRFDLFEITTAFVEKSRCQLKQQFQDHS